MTRKDFQLIANTLSSIMPDSLFDPDQYGQWVLTCQAMAAACATTNPRFNQDKFLAACGIEA